MKKKWIGLLLAFCMAACLDADVRADDLQGQSGWKVTFTQDNKMESNFGRSDMDEAISGMQPGDNITFTLYLESANDKVTDWYLTNEVVNSLEDRSANAEIGGGAYTYYLAYTGSNRTAVLFDSDTVGGEGSEEGLKEATGALQDYVYLDTLGPGQSGSITLRIALDGETQGNHYQDTLADLQMRFAVEVRPDPVTEVKEEPSETPEPGTPGRTVIVRTGDETNMIPYVVAMAVSGLLFLALGLYGVRQNKRQNAGKDKKAEKGAV